MTTVLAIDQGTSGTKAIVVDAAGTVLSAVPRSRCARTTSTAAGSSRTRRRCSTRSSPPGRRALAEAGVPVDAVALANQGETVLAWDPATGRPLTPAIVWQDRRAEAVCAAAPRTATGCAALTGLVLDPYFSAPKMRWLRDTPHHRRAWSPPPTPGWCTGCAGRSSPTPPPRAGPCCSTSTPSPGRAELLGLFGLDGERLPDVVASDEVVGETDAFGGDAAGRPG